MNNKTDKQLQAKRKKKKTVTQHGTDIIDEIGKHLSTHCIKIFWVLVVIATTIIITFLCYGMWCYFHIDTNNIQTQQKFDDFKALLFLLIGCLTRFLKFNKNKEK